MSTISPDSLFQSVGDTSRLRLIRLLGIEELNVREMVQILEMSQPGVSKHLAVLREAGWLRQRRQGTRNWYSLIGADEFPAGAQLHDAVLQQARRLGEAGKDDDALNRILAERDIDDRGVFAEIAEQWDRIRRSFEHTDIQAGAVGALVEPGLRIIDIGTGTGALLPLLADTGARVTAVDNAPAMLDKARTLCERHGLEGVEFREADILDLPFEDDAFDAAYCSMVLHHVAVPQDAMREMARVVKPGGRVVVIAFDKHDQTWLRRELAHAWLGFEQSEIEAFFRNVEIEPVRWIVRGRGETPSEGGAASAVLHDRSVQWPDIFLAVGSVRQS